MNQELEAIFASYKGEKNELMPILQEVQEELGYLPGEAMQKVADFLKIPGSRVYGVATFYDRFHLQPRGRNIIRLCCGTACHVRGAKKIADKIQEVLQVEVGQTTEDMEFTYEEVACIGACGLAPAVIIGRDTYGRLTPDKTEKIIEEVRSKICENGDNEEGCAGAGNKVSP